MLKHFDPILLLLFSGILVFSGVLLYLAKWDAQDGQTFQVFSGLLTGFAGALFTRIKPKADPGDHPNTISGSITIPPTVVVPGNGLEQSHQ